jgi:ankyrin repeat protein
VPVVRPERVMEVKKFIESGADVNEKFRLGKKEKTPQWTPLLWAINFNQFAVAKTLIEAGADVNLNTIGVTPLMIAAGKPNVDIDLVRMLLDEGANVNEQLEGKGKLKKIQGFTPLMFSAASGRVDVVKLLLDRGADINAKDKNGRTALKTANRKLNYDVANLLKEAGAKE